uniref:Acetylglucosaminyltransferase, putative n=1 Tax=Arundo donax TaxID=35708 RepID=A0A0A9E9Z4_ARUDO
MPPISPCLSYVSSMAGASSPSLAVSSMLSSSVMNLIFWKSGTMISFHMLTGLSSLRPMPPSRASQRRSPSTKTSTALHLLVPKLSTTCFLSEIWILTLTGNPSM